VSQSKGLSYKTRETPEALHDSEMRDRRPVQAGRDGILMLDADNGRIMDANPLIVKQLGYSRGDLLGKELWEIGFFEDATASKVALRELQEEGYLRYENLRLNTATGQPIDVEFVSTIYVVDNKPVIRCNIREMDRRRAAEGALRSSERLNRSLVEHLPHRILVRDRNSMVLFCNTNYANDIGIPLEDVIGNDAWAFHPRELAGAYHLDDQEVMASGRMKEIEEPYQIDGEERWVHTVKVPYRDEEKHIIGVLVVFEDITERKRLEEQIRQSQKLEAIGLMAGGVAHDFNNLLTIILGYCDLASGRLGLNDPLVADIKEIRKCGGRAASLTRQLLAFSRKQVLDVRILDLNALVSGVDRMLQRLIGADIDLKTVLAPDLGRIKADSGQIEQIMMNLVVNARDAMPTGGQLTLQTANVYLDQDYAAKYVDVTPGHYVMLAVRDNGCGMDNATKTRIFEPFFTTKEQGKGTGLGLATVHGIVKQSRGNIWCYSKLGQGTTVKIYLPRDDEVAEAVALEAPAPALCGSETILLAEDEGMVRKLIVQMLTLDGYKVIPSKDGFEALQECETFHDPIDLLITDMVMPGMSGYELMQSLVDKRPGIKVLFISGYIDDAVLRHGILEEGMSFLQKPFTRDSLCRKVREVLDS